ncbi:MAG: Zn-dependent hydrolase [Ethanoligenens sp.]
METSENIADQLRALLEEWAAFNATPGNGCTRLPFTKEARRAADCIRRRMVEAGLNVREDAAGNIIGVLPGEDTALPALAVGSHYDTVQNGGNFDGQAGIAVGILLARLLKQNGVRLKRTLAVVAFCDEEGMRFGTGYFGSKAMLGQITQEDLHHFRDKDDVSVYDAMKAYGLVPEKIGEARQDLSKIAAFIEMHIEQGPVLDQNHEEIGLVECIVGIQRYVITVHGRADHAGTTPMDMRADAMEAAAKVIAQLPDWARAEGDGTVATTGYCRAVPGGMNIIAGEVQFSVDVRSRCQTHIDTVVSKLRAALNTACSRDGVSWDMDCKLDVAPVDLSTSMLDLLEQSCQTHGYRFRRMISGAGHDALAIGQVLDTVMLFVPSKDGRSHCPAEWTEYADIAKAVHVLYDLVLAMQ